MRGKPLLLLLLGLLACGCPSEEPAGTPDAGVSDLGPEPDAGPTWPRIRLYLDDMPIDWSQRPVFVGPPFHLSNVFAIDIANPGGGTLMVESIEWLRVDGAPAAHPWLRLEAEHLSMPVAVSPGGKAAFWVWYEPPVAAPPTDVSPSSVVIRSNALDATGTSQVGEVVLHFVFAEQAGGVPTIEPPTYAFQYAQPTKPERMTFEVRNHPILATEPFEVKSVYLSVPSDVFRVENAPSPGRRVLEPRNPYYPDSVATFDVVYAPPAVDSLDEAKVLVYTDVGIFDLLVSSDPQTASFSLEFSHEDEFDFAGAEGAESRRVTIISEGPGPLTVREPELDPSDIDEFFGFKAFLPTGHPELPEEEVCQWLCDRQFPRILEQGRTIDIEVTFDPGIGPNPIPHGRLLIPTTIPDPLRIPLPVMAGEPRGVMRVAPANQLIWVSTRLAYGLSGSRYAVFLNEGNSDLVVQSIAAETAFGDPSQVFQLKGVPPTDLVIPPRGLHVLEVSWDATRVPAGATTVDEFLHIEHLDGFTGLKSTLSMQLRIQDTGSLQVPVAVLPDDSLYPDATAGEPLILNAFDSTPGSFEFPSDAPFCYWYLRSKPPTSQAWLNEEAGMAAALMPDVPGSYFVELVVFSDAPDGPDVLFSEPATLLLTVD